MDDYIKLFTYQQPKSKPGNFNVRQNHHKTDRTKSKI
jgi:hypothetical protein